MDNSLNLNILNDEGLFHSIHQLREQFIHVFSDLGNKINETNLFALHADQKGVKISQGNALQHCPYQVLDIIRDFDKHSGFNIRIMNWWGHGLYLLVFMGQNNTLSPRQYKAYQAASFEITETGSPFDYAGIIGQGRKTSIPDAENLSKHLTKYHHIQLIKQLSYPTDTAQLLDLLQREWSMIVNIHEGN
ncbi:hypothetical protein GCM10007049_24410 [Echinicola pacifica]|uniref:Uncharacterized protein n=1 Tax=Echinicola pacifica TaxID=346377 RepID=A0A918Q4A4_9BACT|nr:hypothetical protein [Echinicola pacifica]GGZ30661.1 hypothetical protein GCM10007049_24410 [Echinicola pacifica]